MRRENFIRAELDVSMLVAKRAEDIVPMLQRAVAASVRSRSSTKTAAAEPLSRM